MTIERVEVMVEEPSMEIALRSLLPRMLGATSFEIYGFSCKDEMLQRLPQRLRGYTTWLPDTYRVVIVVDRDGDDCKELKERLDRMARDAGLRVRGGAGNWQVVNRLAIEELEAWYFGDWSAVRAVYPKVPATISAKQGFRDPDAIKGGTWERFEQVLQQAGYFSSGLAKRKAATVIAPAMEPERNRSQSFGKLRDLLSELRTE